MAYYAGAGDISNIKAYPYGHSGLSNAKVNITDYPAYGTSWASGRSDTGEGR